MTYQIQTLKLHADLFPGVRDGSKYETTRKGERDIKLGALKFECPDNKLEHIVFVYKVEKVFASSLRPAKFQELLNFYPDLDGAAPVTIIHFEAT